MARTNRSGLTAAGSLWLNARPACAVVALALAVAACHHPPAARPLAEAQRLFQEGKWGEAIPPFKRHLLTHPDDAAAHFYLGRCYLLSAPMRPAYARGELETARQVFLRGGKHSPIEGYSDLYFEFICHIEMGKVSLRQMELLIEWQTDPDFLKPLLEQARKDLEEARHLIPDSQDVKDLDNLLRQCAAFIEGEPPQPPVPAPSETQSHLV